MSLARHIALVGLPGAGKTRVGRALAARLGCPFADSDEEVERAAGMTVAEIFAADGEGAFRRLERQAVARLLGAEPGVIALGGGAFEDPSTRAALLARSLVVWLDLPIALLAERLRGDATRPLLSEGDLGARLHELSVRRLPQYAQAHLRIVTACSAGTVEKIVAALSQSDIAADSASR